MTGHKHHNHTGCSCGCGHEHHHTQDTKKEIIEIAISAVLFLIGVLLKEIIYIVAVASFVVAYILLGRDILKSAAKNIWKGHVFDENFLMSIATLAAFAIGDFAEAVGVMLFFRIGELFEEKAVEKSRNQIMEAVDMRPETVQLVHEQIVFVYFQLRIEQFVAAILDGSVTEQLFDCHFALEVLLQQFRIMVVRVNRFQQNMDIEDSGFRDSFHLLIPVLDKYPDLDA